MPVGMLVGGAFLSAVVKLLFDRLASLEVIDFFQEKILIEGTLMKLKIALQSVNAVLEDAEEKQVTNPAVKEWLDDLKDAIYDAEDILDEIDTTTLQTSVPSKLKKFTSEFLTTFFKKIDPKIEEIIQRLEALAKQKNDIGLRQLFGGKPSERSPTTSLVEESGIVGRDVDRETIINLLLSDDAGANQMGVVAMVGMGGIGKTTLAQLVYNDERAKKHFDLEAWICVSEEFDLFRVTETILESVTSSTCVIKDLNRLQVTLKEKLMGKRFLLVLDDVWNKNYADWEVLSNPFKSGAKGSRVIVTTRDEDVASVMRASATYRLKQLSDNDCWSLFAKHAFHDGDSIAYLELEKIGREIVEKCKGLPLAIKAIGSLLWSKRDVGEWYKILKSKLWDLPNDGRNILPALRLSYKYLPSHLKRCFAYCSIFPKGHVFKKDQLILLWMAEGFVQQPNNKTMEEFADDCLLDLVSWSLFQQSSGNKPGFVMHDLVNDLATFVSGQLSLRLEGDYSQNIVKKTRHLSYLVTRSDNLKKFEQGLSVAKKLRTFFLLESNVDFTQKGLDDLLKLKRLRVLSLSYCGNISELSDSISEIAQLRYLDFSCTSIKSLPNSICELCNLQTLKLSQCPYLVALPEEMQKLISLRHLDLSFSSIKKLPDSISELCNLQTLKLSGCLHLVALPKDMHKLISLCHLDLSFTELGALPNFIYELCNLQTLQLSGYDPLDALLTNMCKLINLCHLDLSQTKVENLPDSICELCKLQTLNLSSCRDLTVLPRDMWKLFNLRHLDITEAGIKEMPIQLGRLKYLQTLTKFIISNNSTGSCNIGELGKLVNLRGKLCISQLQKVDEFPGDTRDGSLVKMKYLEELVMEWNDDTNIPESRQIIVLDSLRPHTDLKSLTIKYYSSERFPAWVGHHSFSNIATLDLENCKYCCSLPPLGQLPSLQNLSIVRFDGLVTVGPEFHGSSTGSSSINPFGTLKFLRFSNMLKWEKWFSVGVQNEGGAFPRLEELYVEKCPKLKASLPRAPSVRELWLQNCQKDLLRELPTGIRKLVVSEFGDELKSFPEGMLDSNNCLQVLRILTCSSLTCLSPGGGLPSTLKSIEISHCEKLQLPMDLIYRSLEKLSLSYSCDSLQSLKLELFPELKEIIIHQCKNLRSLTVPEEYGHDLVAFQIVIRDCPEFVSFPIGGLCAPNLETFKVRDCGKLSSLPEKMHIFLRSLKEVVIENCPEIKSYPEGGFPSHLNKESIQITGCPHLRNRHG